MQHVKKAIRNSGKSCSSCSGSIVETFVEETDTSEPMRFGSRRPTFIRSMGYGCSKCGLLYGQPVFTRTNPDEEVLFQFSLRSVTLTKKIDKNDIAPIITYKQIPIKGAGKKGDVIFKKGATMNGKMKATPVKMVPKPLTEVKVGDTVYLLSDETVRRDLKLELWLDYIEIQISKDKNAEKFIIKKDCVN